MSTAPRQSLTVVVGVADAERCATELELRRDALQAGWARMPGLHSACLALLPPSTLPATDAALLFECSFDGPFAELKDALFAYVGEALNAVLSHCDGYPVTASAPAFAEYLGARARRSAALRESDEPVAIEVSMWRRVQRAFDSLRPRSPVASHEAELEPRRGAVGLQEAVPGVPLLHVARLIEGARARHLLTNALRDVELEPARFDHGARFLVHGERLLFLAYPNQNAPRWSERLSQAALATLSLIYRNARGFSGSPLSRRARRERRLQQFLLDGRVPVAAWFNARAPLREV